MIPPTRINLRAEAPEAHDAMIAFSRQVGAGIDPALHELVKLRVSQINGCAYCVDKHSRDALRAGEDDRRLHSVAVWHEAPFFTARERAALALADSVTLVSETHVPDDVWIEAEKHFSRSEVAHLVLAIAAMNALNRTAITSRMRPPATIT